MADSENIEVSEKESAQHEEKEEDTTSDSKKHLSPSKTATSPGSKRRGSSQSRVSRASSTGGIGSPKGEKKKAEKSKEGEKGKGGEKGKEGEKGKGGEKGKEGGKGKGKAKEEIKHELGDGDEEEVVLPEGCAALFMTSKTQEIFHCVCDVDVTEENPIKIITRQEIMDDMFNRAAVSDFSPFKQQILDFPSDEILIVYDHEFKYGQNFYIALTEEAKELILKPIAVETEADELNEEEEEEVIYKYIPPEPKDWVSFGSEKEIVEENVVETRNRVKVSVKRLRKHFGAPCSFTDRNSGDTKQSFIECLPFEDRSFDLKKVELVKATQAVPQQQDAATQTRWKYPRNANTQYYPREFNHHELEDIQKSDIMLEFVKSVVPRFNLALQQNAIMNVFYDDWINLGDADDAFGSKADNHLKEYQSFTDLQFSKDKTITCIQWHPVLKGTLPTSKKRCSDL